MFLDPATITTTAAFLFLVLTLLSAAIGRQRGVYPGFGRWTLANVLLTACMVIASSLPSATIWTNILFVTAMILSAEGNRAFRGLRPRFWWLYSAGAAAVIAAAYFEHSQNPNGRNGIIGLCLALTSIVSAIILISDPPAGRKLGMRFTGAMYGLFAVVTVTRAAFFLSNPRFIAEPMRANFFFHPAAGGEFQLAGVLPVLCCSIGWLVMVDERHLADAKEQEAKAQATADQAASADLAKGEFLATIGHEIRNSLSVVLNLTDLVLATELTTEQKDYETGVRSSIEAVIRVTDDILDLSNIESGRMAIESTRFDFCVLVDSIGRVFRPVAAQKGLDFVVDYDQRLPHHFLGDAGRLRQVITNLAGNALKFTTHGEIRMAVSCQGLSLTEARVRVSVTDCGIGIPPEWIGTLFRKFGSAHEATAPTHGGSGIGLRISKQLIEVMGGRLDVNSEVGRGSSFWFELTLSLAEPFAKAQTSA